MRYLIIILTTLSFCNCNNNLKEQTNTKRIDATAELKPKIEIELTGPLLVSDSTNYNDLVDLTNSVNIEILKKYLRENKVYSLDSGIRIRIIDVQQKRAEIQVLNAKFTNGSLYTPNEYLEYKEPQIRSHYFNK